MEYVKGHGKCFETLDRLNIFYFTLVQTVCDHVKVMIPICSCSRRNIQTTN